jgi:hypothetical protein
MGGYGGLGGWQEMLQYGLPADYFNRYVDNVLGPLPAPE